MKNIITTLFLCITTLSFGQTTYTRVTATNSYYSYSEVKYDYGPYYFNQTMGLVKGILYDKKMQELKLEHQRMMKQKTNEYREYYAGLGNYPDVIGDGWHDVIILSGDRMMDERKVYVKDNKIVSVIWDNWLPEECSMVGKIEKGKSVLSFKDASYNWSGLVDVFFFNTITDAEARASEPLRAAKLVFWTTKGSYKNMKVSISNTLYGPFVVKHKKKDVIDVDDVQELAVYVKPGIIEYGRGSLFSGSIVGQAGRIKAESGQSYVLRIK